MARDLDDLMNDDPLNLSDQDVSDIIDYNRKVRGLIDEGKKPPKGGKKLDPVALGLKKAPEPFDRRF